MPLHKSSWTNSSDKEDKEITPTNSPKTVSLDGKVITTADLHKKELVYVFGVILTAGAFIAH